VIGYSLYNFIKGQCHYVIYQTTGMIGFTIGQ